MKAPVRLRTWVTVVLGLAAAALAYFWPAFPRGAVQCENICWHFAFSSDGTRLAVLDREAGVNVPGQILVLEVASGEILHRLDLGIRLYPSRVAFAPDGKSLGVVDTGAVTKWDLTSGRVLAHYDHAAW